MSRGGYLQFVSPFDMENVEKLVARRDREFPSLKVMVSLGGWQFSTHRVCQDIFSKILAPEVRTNLAYNVRDFLDKYKLDGVEVDFYGPASAERNGKPEDTPNLTGFMKDLRAILPRNKLISLAAPGGYTQLREFQIPEIAKSVDFISVKAFDYVFSIP